jgi:hypothetical protein
MRNLRMQGSQNIWLLKALVEKLQLSQYLVAWLTRIAYDYAERLFGHAYCGKPVKPVLTACKLVLCYGVALALVYCL